MLTNGKVVREGYWDEHIQYIEGRVYAFGWFTRHWMKWIHGADTKLPGGDHV